MVETKKTKKLAYQEVQREYGLLQRNTVFPYKNNVCPGPLTKLAISKVQKFE